MASVKSDDSLGRYEVGDYVRIVYTVGKNLVYRRHTLAQIESVEHGDEGDKYTASWMYRLSDLCRGQQSKYAASAFAADNLIKTPIFASNHVFDLEKESIDWFHDRNGKPWTGSICGFYDVSEKELELFNEPLQVRAATRSRGACGGTSHGTAVEYAEKVTMSVMTAVPEQKISDRRASSSSAPKWMSAMRQPAGTERLNNGDMNPREAVEAPVIESPSIVSSPAAFNIGGKGTEDIIYSYPKGFRAPYAVMG